MNCGYALLITLFVLAGCISGCMSSQPAAVVSAPHASEEMILNEIKQSARSIERSWANIGRLQQARATPAIRSPATKKHHSGVLAQRITLDWHGTLHTLLQHIARQIGYRFDQQGRAPGIPVIVNLHVRNMSVGDILQQAGWQAGKQAGVRVDVARRQISLLYPPNPAAPAATSGTLSGR